MHLRLAKVADRLQDEEGTSMVELLVGLAMGMIVLAGLSLLLIVTLHGNARVDARVEASDNARIAMTRIMEELHSACVTPQVAPVQAESTLQTLVFTHDPSGVASTPEELPVESKVFYSNGVLYQAEKHATGGTQLSPIWGPWEAAQIVVSNVAPANTDGSIFRYYKFEAAEAKTPLPAPVGTGLGSNAAETILVEVKFKASPRNEPVADAGAATTIQNSATLRLTPPNYLESKAMPCQ
jgi:Tfp pilus assembly protein PilW